jgi:Tfp pilus assembly protein PilN
MNDSFLPPEYTELRTDRRTHVLAMLLFAIILVAVLAAFAWKRDEWRQIEQVHREVEARYIAAGAEVEQLMTLKKAQETTLRRAELAAALVEKVPRSILLAELVNSMPPGLGLHEFRLDSKRIIVKPPTDASAGRKPRGGTRSPVKDSRPEPPQYDTKLSLTGFAPTDVHVSEFLAALNAHPLLDNVNLVSSKETMSQDRTVREFKLTATLARKADVRFLAAGRFENGHQQSLVRAQGPHHE